MKDLGEVMNQNVSKIYAARVVQASPTELVAITYELIIEEIEKAECEYKEENKEKLVYYLKRAQRFLAHMMESLDYQYDISFDLLRLYLYINKRIINSICKLDPKELKNTKSILEKLKKGFKEISHQDKSSSVMENTQQIYAGLTYGKETLNEININPKDLDRGYKI